MIVKAKTLLPKKVKLVEVGPRDGLQNEKLFVDNLFKVNLIDQLSLSGFANVEAAAFVSPKWVPQMAGSAQVMAQIKREKTAIYSVLVPNMQGLEQAIQAKVDEVVIFGAATESFSQKNINCSIQESIARFEPVAKEALRNGLRLRASISCALGCPYEGDVSADQVQEMVKRMAALGCDEIDIADTIGVGTAERVKKVFEKAFLVFPHDRLAGHFHDTYGQALANIYAAMQVGVGIFHTSVAGLGGCPYAKGATGNVATEDVLFMMKGLGVETGIDLDRVVRAGDYICKILHKEYGSRAGKALLARMNPQAA